MISYIVANLEYNLSSVFDVVPVTVVEILPQQLNRRLQKKLVYNNHLKDTLSINYNRKVFR